MSSTPIEKVKKILGGQINYSFQYEKLTSEPTVLGSKYKNFLSPHSKFFYSPICSLFSFELISRSGNYIKTFDAVSLKDGLLPLSYFFMENKIPHEVDPILLVDERLKAIIPKAWCNNVVLKKIVCTKFLPDVKKLVLIVTPDSKTSSSQEIERELQKISSAIKPDTEIKIFFTKAQFRGEETVEVGEGVAGKIYHKIFNEFKNHNCQVLDWSEYLSTSAYNSHYFVLNPNLFYFSESYLEHDLLQRGACPLFQESKEEIDIQLSLTHGYALKEISESYEKSDEFYQLMETILEGKYKSIKNENEFETCELGSEEFRSLVLGFSKKYTIK